jgi:hypothetical protein
MRNVRDLLQSEREFEQEFALEAVHEPDHPTGWSAALLLFHISRWRERLRDRLTQAREGRPVEPLPDADTINAVELVEGAGMSLQDAAAYADKVFGEVIDLWSGMGDKPFKWFTAQTTGEALARNSYLHPRVHLAEHFIERGNRVRGYRIFEVSAEHLRNAEAPPHTLGSAIYDLACARVGQARILEALPLLEEAMQLRPDLRSSAPNDPDLAPLKNVASFQALLKR